MWLAKYSAPLITFPWSKIFLGVTKEKGKEKQHLTVDKLSAISDPWKTLEKCCLSFSLNTNTRLRHLDFDIHTQDCSLAWPPTMAGLCSNLQQYPSLDYAAKLAADASVVNLSLAVCFRKNELENSASSALYQPQKTAWNHEVKLKRPWRILEQHCHIPILQFHPLSWKDV